MRTVIISLCGLDDITCIPYRLVVILGVSNTFIRSALRMNSYVSEFLLSPLTVAGDGVHFNSLTPPDGRSRRMSPTPHCQAGECQRAVEISTRTSAHSRDPSSIDNVNYPKAYVLTAGSFVSYALISVAITAHIYLKVRSRRRTRTRTFF